MVEVPIAAGLYSLLQRQHKFIEIVNKNVSFTILEIEIHGGKTYFYSSIERFRECMEGMFTFYVEISI